MNKNWNITKGLPVWVSRLKLPILAKSKNNANDTILFFIYVCVHVCICVFMCVRVCLPWEFWGLKERNPQTEIPKWGVGVLGREQSVGTSLPVATGCAEGQTHHGLKPNFNAFLQSHVWHTGRVEIWEPAYTSLFFPRTFSSFKYTTALKAGTEGLEKPDPHAMQSSPLCA